MSNAKQFTVAYRETQYVAALNRRENVKRNGGNLPLANFECKMWAHRLSETAIKEAKRKLGLR